jgi:hypothetical protein
MSEEQKRLLEKQLWGVANLLRGKMNADEYKNYILGSIFYKYLSEKLARYVDENIGVSWHCESDQSGHREYRGYIRVVTR